MTAPHQDTRVETAIRDGAQALAEVATAALPSPLRTLARPYRAKLATALETGVRELLAKLGLVTGKVKVDVAPGVPVEVVIVHAGDVFSRCASCGWTSRPGELIRGLQCRCGGRLERVEVRE